MLGVSCDACGSWACMPVEGCDALAQRLYDARMPLDVQSCLPQLYFVSYEGECHAVVVVLCFVRSGHLAHQSECVHERSLMYNNSLPLLILALVRR